jgi:hypothetical protein
MLFGVVLTNVCYLLYRTYPQWDQPFLELDTDANPNNSYTVSTGMVLLWTVGGGLHTMYNLVIWHVAACACCQLGGCWHVVVAVPPEDEDNDVTSDHAGEETNNATTEEHKSIFRYCPSLGKHLVRVIVLVILVLATWVVLIRVEVEEQQVVDGDENDPALDTKVDLQNHSAQEFDFLLGYLVEMGLALFLWYPLGAMLLFSGVLACGCNVPFLGGRPRDVKLERQKKARMLLDMQRIPCAASRKSVTTSNTGSSEAAEEDTVEINPVESSSSSSADDDIELVWTPRARREFEDSRATL